ncbi:alpha/beta fold hydrolase [Erythrobacter sp. WH131]|uniref:Alpha/beta fold hydrolase n=2 Tax=Erythrobacter ani TaxID=2827235 RepID=A0ABS6SL61_9SPHN|nr:alpha/beta fold hydrolase [Erythrobacter ani]MBV7265237.1 alpha/beta fold hydrolase [Erythrobacter ani]
MLTISGTGRRVHYRRCGSGPMLLMVHQSPRSSAEYTALMQQWGARFTCVAPDTPGFGQSDPLPETDDAKPEIADFADALCEFLDALGVDRVPAYGFHSGGIILVTALKRQPQRFACLAVGGYAIWNEQEMRIFGERYLPEFHPSDYGEHLTWLWNRMLEQSWVFPWFDTREEARLSVAHADIPRVAQAVSEMLDAGNAYQAGYGAVLRAPRDIPPSDADVPPCLITAYDGDPLQEHIDRLGEMPAGWQAEKVRTPADHQAASLAFLQDHAADEASPDLPEDGDEGWLSLDGGLIHWRGEKGGKLVLHGPAGELAEPAAGEITIDVPGHGQSDDFEDMRGAVEATAQALGSPQILWPDLPSGDPAKLYPDTMPDRFGQYLQRAWAVARAEVFFEPWYEASAASAVPLDEAALNPAALHARALARIRAGDAARRWHETLIAIDGATQ